MHLFPVAELDWFPVLLARETSHCTVKISATGSGHGNQAIAKVAHGTKCQHAEIFLQQLAQTTRYCELYFRLFK